MMFNIQSISIRFARRQFALLPIGKLFQIFLVLGLVQLSNIGLVKAGTSNLTENVKLQYRAELNCRFVDENLTLVLVYGVDSYLLSGTRYDVLQSKLKLATSGDRDVTKIYQVDFGSSDLEGQFMIAYQSTVSDEKIPIRGLSSSEAIWAFSTTSTAFTVPLSFIMASPLTEVGDKQQFDHPSIGQWEMVIEDVIANQQKGSVTGWLRGPDGATMTITDGRCHTMRVANHLVRNLETTISLDLEATFPKPPVEVGVEKMMTDLWFDELDEPSNVDGSEILDQDSSGPSEVYQIEITYNSELVDQIALTQGEADVAQQLLQRVEIAKHTLVEAYLEGSDRSVDAQLSVSLSDSTQPSILSPLLSDLSSVLTQLRPRAKLLAQIPGTDTNVLGVSNDAVDQPGDPNALLLPHMAFVASPVEGENDVVLSWQPHPGTRVQGYEVLANGEVIGHIDNPDKVEFYHYDLIPDAQITYQVRGITEANARELAESAITNEIMVVVGTDTTPPLPPELMEEGIPFEKRESLDEVDRMSDRLITWESSPSGDTVSYQIRRGDTVLATIPADENQYFDSQGDFSQEYAVYAIDDGRNQSDKGGGNEGDWGAMFERLERYTRDGELGKFIVASERLMANAPFPGIAQYLRDRLIETFSSHQELPKLITVYASAVESEGDLGDPNSDQLRNYLLTLAVACLVADQTDRAIEAYQQLLVNADDSERVELSSNLAQAYQKKGDVQQAITILTSAIEEQPNRYGLYRQLAEAYADLEMMSKVQEIAQQLQQVLDRIDKSNRRGRRGFFGDRQEGVFSALGRIYMMARDYDRSVATFKRGIFDTRNRYLISSLADSYQAAGQTETAEQIRAATQPDEEEDRRGRNSRRSEGIVPDTPMVDINGDEIRLPDFSDKIIILHFFSSNESKTNLHTLSKFFQDKKGSLQVVGIMGDHSSEEGRFAKKTDNLEQINFPIVRFNRAEWDLFEFAVGFPIRTVPTTLTVIGDGLLVDQKHYADLSIRALENLVKSTRQRRSSLDRDPNVLWANRVVKFSSQYSDTDWSAEQVLGSPDTYPAHGDRPTAWCPKMNNTDQTEFIRVGFESPTYMEGLKVYETCNPGAIVRVVAVDEVGQSYSLWQPERPETIFVKKRIFRIQLPPTKYKVDMVEIHLRPQANSGWNQIDAIGLLYPQN